MKVLPSLDAPNSFQLLNQQVLAYCGCALTVLGCVWAVLCYVLYYVLCCDVLLQLLLLFLLLLLR
jgi:hypothetical protein